MRFQTLTTNVLLCSFFLFGCGAQQNTTSTVASISSPTNSPHAHALELCTQTNTLIAANGLANSVQIKSILDLVIEQKNEMMAIVNSGTGTSETAFTISDCVKNSLVLSFNSFDALPESAFFETKLTVSSVLEQLYAARSHAIRILAISPMRVTLGELIDNAHLRKKIFATAPQNFTLSEVAKVLAERALTPELEQTLLEILPYAANQIPLAADVKIVPESARQIFLKLTATNIAKNAFSYSTRFRHSQIAGYEEQIKFLEQQQKNCKQSDSCPTDAQIDALKETVRVLKSTPSGPLATFKAFEKSLVDAEIPYAKELLNSAMIESQTAFATEIRTGALTLREGDIWTQLSQGGAGDFFMQVSQNGTFATHSGAVAQEWEDGFPIWFTVEMSNGPRFSEITTDHDRIFWRPSFVTEPGFTAQAIKNLAALGKIKFDALFTPGIFDSHGKPSLYCAELVHYLFKNRFNPKGPEYVSPFDGMRNTLTHLTTTAQKNIQLLGTNPADEKFAPENFHYSALINFVGFTQNSDMWIPDNEQLSYITSVRKRLNTHMATLVSTRPLAPVPFTAKLQVDALILTGNLGEFLLPVLSQPKANTVRTAMFLSELLPEGKSRYYFGNTLFKVQNSANKLQLPKDPDGNLPPNWKELLERKYADEVIPEIESLFKKSFQ